MLTPAATDNRRVRKWNPLRHEASSECGFGTIRGVVDTPDLCTVVNQMFLQGAPGSRLFGPTIDEGQRCVADTRAEILDYNAGMHRWIRESL